MISQTLTITVADRLCREAERLERVWSDPDLDPGFVMDQVLAVLRFLDKVGRAQRSRTEQAEFAAALLRDFCRRNGRRDIARASQGRSTGVRPAFVSLDALREAGWDAPGNHPQAAWLNATAEEEDARTLPRDLARFLESRGWDRERAWMFVWAEYEGLEWEKVARLMAERFEVQTTSAALRKWAERNWPAARAIAADFWAQWRDGNAVRNGNAVTEPHSPGISQRKGFHSGARTRRKEVTHMGT